MAGPSAALSLARAVLVEGVASAAFNHHVGGCRSGLGSEHNGVRPNNVGGEPVAKTRWS